MIFKKKYDIKYILHITYIMEYNKKSNDIDYNDQITKKLENIKNIQNQNSEKLKHLIKLMKTINDNK